MFGIVRVYTSFVLIRRRRESQPSHKLVPKHSENQVQKLDTFAFEGLGMECPMLVTAARSPLLPLWASPLQLRHRPPKPMLKLAPIPVVRAELQDDGIRPATAVSRFQCHHLGVMASCANHEEPCPLRNIVLRNDPVIAFVSQRVFQSRPKIAAGYRIDVHWFGERGSGRSQGKK